MFEIQETEPFLTWFKKLKDKQAKARILIRLKRVAQGNLGVVAPIGEGVSELKFDFGPGYRVYFWIHRNTVVFLLGGGDKSSQDKDILEAKVLAKQLKEQYE